MRDALSLTDPDWDISVGTVEYKILEAVAKELATVYNTGVISDYHFDVETKSGVYLDRFVGLFGVTRLLARRATGTATFSRGTPATEEVFIPTGAQVYRPATIANPVIFFQTTVLRSIDIGSTSVVVPVEAVIPGASGNIVAASITSFGSNISGVTSVTNGSTMTGGIDREADEDLRERWRITAFKSIAGTEDSYLDLSLSQEKITRAIVIGPSMRRIEQLQLSASVATSQISDVKYVYPQGTEFVGVGLDTEVEELGIFNTDYTFTPGPPASATLVAGGQYVNGGLVEIEYDYVPNASRNDPVNGVLHRVDVFVLGEEAKSITEVIKFSTSASIEASGTYDQVNWLRTTGVVPVVGSMFMPLVAQPVITPPDTIMVGADLRTLNTHYRFIRDVTTRYGSMRALDGIEWLTGYIPVNETSIEVTYTHNALIRSMQDLFNRAKTVGTDLLVHKARIVNYRINLAVVYNKGVSKVTSDQEIEDAIVDWFASKFFGNSIQISDLFNVVRAIIGVDNVRLVTSDENGTNYGIQRLSEDGTILSTSITDRYLASDELPSLYTLSVTQRAQNTF